MADASSVAPPAVKRGNMAGLAVLIGGICFVVAPPASEAVDALWSIMVVGVALLIYGIPQLHRHQAPADGAIGHWGSRLIVFGGSLILLLGVMFLVWEAVGDAPEEPPGPVGALFPIGFFSFFIGVILFAIGTLKAKVFPQAAPIVMLVGLVSALGIDMATGAFFEDTGETTAWGFILGLPVFGLGLAWMGYALWRSRSDEVEVSTPTA